MLQSHQYKADAIKLQIQQNLHAPKSDIPFYRRIEQHQRREGENE
jgi:hypothetical protein